MQNTVTDSGLKRTVTIAGFISAKTSVYFRITKENFKSNLVLRYEFILASSNDLMSDAYRYHAVFTSPEGRTGFPHTYLKGRESLTLALLYVHLSSVNRDTAHFCCD